MKQLKADIATISNIRDPRFQHLAQYHSLRAIRFST
jgi:hypothetical protein